MRQNETNLEYKTGITPHQENVAVSLAGGKTITETAADLNISRATIYRLLNDDLFSAYYQFLCSEIKLNIKNKIFSLQDKAFAAIGAALESDNDNSRLKAATWIIDKIQSVEIENTSPLTAIRRQCTHYSVEDYGFDKPAFERLKKQYDL